jgi:cytochrome c biogenesis protein CcmG, thiol:disulfide interchange protein DsbE
MNKTWGAFFIFWTLSQFVFSQGRTIPSVTLKTLSGESINSLQVLSSDSSIVILSFWATWCKPCLQELDNLNEILPVWQKSHKIKLVAVSVDDARNTQKLPAFVAGRGWKFEVISDANAELKRLLNVVNVPHTFLLNRDARIAYQHTSYAPGDEDELWEKVKQLK